MLVQTNNALRRCITNFQRNKIRKACSPHYFSPLRPKTQMTCFGCVQGGGGYATIDKSVPLQRCTQPKSPTTRKIHTKKSYLPVVLGVSGIWKYSLSRITVASPLKASAVTISMILCMLAVDSQIVSRRLETFFSPVRSTYKLQCTNAKWSVHTQMAEPTLTRMKCHIVNCFLGTDAWWLLLLE